jgi:heme/copper-type cytochrome/quinol oxidase subunit 3
MPIVTLNLTLESGIYGSTFFMLTGFHGMHVTLGTIMLFVIMIRAAKGHFTADKHFAFEGVAWYWHFVDVVWLGSVYLRLRAVSARQRAATEALARAGYQSAV